MRKQRLEETLDDFLHSLKLLSKDCNFQNVSANEYRDQAIRDAIISGLLDPNIRKRLLENRNLDLQSTSDQARPMELAKKNSEVRAFSEHLIGAAAETTNEKPPFMKLTSTSRYEVSKTSSRLICLLLTVDS